MEQNTSQNRQGDSLGQMIPFVVLATLAVLCRFLARKVKKTSIGADDYMIVIGLILTWATFADSIFRELLFQKYNALAI